MFIEARGDMFAQAPAGALIGIPVNTVGVAGKGLARWMKLTHPEATKKYIRACRNGSIAVGDLVVYDTGAYVLAMLPTKYNWVNPSSTQLIKETVERLLQYMVTRNIDVAHIPRLGCGVATGMLNWEMDVKPIITQYFGESEELPHAVVVYDGSP